MRVMLYKHSGPAISSFGFGFQMEENSNQAHSYLVLKMLPLVFWDLAAPPFIFLYICILCVFLEVNTRRGAESLLLPTYNLCLLKLVTVGISHL